VAFNNFFGNGTRYWSVAESQAIAEVNQLGPGNISEFPLFKGAFVADPGVRFDYHLQSSIADPSTQDSPSIDAGEPVKDIFDIVGKDKVTLNNTSGIDIDAVVLLVGYEDDGNRFIDNYFVKDVNGNQVTVGNDIDQSIDGKLPVPKKYSGQYLVTETTYFLEEPQNNGRRINMGAYGGTSQAASSNVMAAPLFEEMAAEGPVAAIGSFDDDDDGPEPTCQDRLAEWETNEIFEDGVLVQDPLLWSLLPGESLPSDFTDSRVIQGTFDGCDPFVQTIAYRHIIDECEDELFWWKLPHPNGTLYICLEISEIINPDFWEDNEYMGTFPGCDPCEETVAYKPIPTCEEELAAWKAGHVNTTEYLCLGGEGMSVITEDWWDFNVLIGTFDGCMPDCEETIAYIPLEMGPEPPDEDGTGGPMA